jgi:hypothetical protein
MKALMSKVLREILRDPKKRLQLEKGMFKHSSDSDDVDKTIYVVIGKHEYKIKEVVSD